MNTLLNELMQSEVAVIRRTEEPGRPGHTDLDEFARCVRSELFEAITDCTRNIAPATGPVADPESFREPPKPHLDENVQFTVYRPKAVKPMAWYPMLAFAHLDDRPDGADDDELDPVEEVIRQRSF